MTPTEAVDVVVVGSGPNGLSAAVTLAAAGLSVTVVEGADDPGGGCRTEDLTVPGFRHDVCSAVHPMVLVSPFFRQPAFDGLRNALCQPEVPVRPADRRAPRRWPPSGPSRRRWPASGPTGPPTGG